MSELKVNKLSPRSGTAVTLGDSGDTFTIPSGATLAIAGSVTGFTSAGIDDNATSVAITIDSSENVGIGTTSPSRLLHLNTTGSGTNTYLQLTSDATGTGTLDGFQIIVAGSDGATILSQRENSSLQFTTNNTERMRITSAGNVGIGTTSPTDVLTVSGANAHIDVTNSSNSSVALLGASGSSGDAPNRGYLRLKKDGSADDGISLNTNGNSWINNGGNLGIGTISPSYPLELHGDGGSVIFTIKDTDASPTFSNRYIRFQDGSGTEIGKVLRQGSAVSYSTSSDYRLKENVVEMTNATDRLKQLQPKRFNFIGYDNVFDGFLAHEVQDIVPEAISGEKDAVDENGNPVYQGIDQSKLVPLLVKTIQELEARITQLENA